MIRIAAVFSLAFLVGQSAAQELSLIKIVDSDASEKTIVSTRLVQKQVPQIRTIAVDVNGTLETKTVTEITTVTESTNVTTSLQNAKGYDGEGKKLTDAQLWQRAKAGEVIVVVQGQLPDVSLLKPLRKEALIVVLPARPAPPQQ